MTQYPGQGLEQHSYPLPTLESQVKVLLGLKQHSCEIRLLCPQVTWPFSLCVVTWPLIWLLVSSF